MILKLVGVVGFIGSGKSTVGDVFASELGYKKVSFASTLKDATSILFSWDRALLEGDTEESRNWREQEDLYWSEKLKKKITPRYILQIMGTEVIRDSLDENFWVLALEKKLQADTSQAPGYIVTDVRFPNEMNWIKSQGGIIVHVRRGDKPDWYNTALINNTSEHVNAGIPAHPSEWKWIMPDDYYDHIIENNGSLEDLQNNTKKIWSN